MPIAMGTPFAGSVAVHGGPARVLYVLSRDAEQPVRLVRRRLGHLLDGRGASPVDVAERLH